MPLLAAVINPKSTFTWLHHSPITDASLPAKPSHSRLSAISSQKIGGELPASRDTGGLGWDRASALSLLGAYTGLMYALPVAGGWVADRLLGYRRALIGGGRADARRVSAAHVGSGVARVYRRILDLTLGVVTAATAILAAVLRPALRGSVAAGSASVRRAVAPSASHRRRVLDIGIVEIACAIVAKSRRGRSSLIIVPFSS